jgi:hypothetical protein
MSIYYDEDCLDDDLELTPKEARIQKIIKSESTGSHKENPEFKLPKGFPPIDLRIDREHKVTLYIVLYEAKDIDYEAARISLEQAKKQIERREKGKIVDMYIEAIASDPHKVPKTYAQLFLQK